jgi:cell shape-determining protein MreC
MLDEIQDIMELERDVEKEQKILTQMAILQRELERLKQPEKQ